MLFSKKQLLSGLNASVRLSLKYKSFLGISIYSNGCLTIPYRRGITEMARREFISHCLKKFFPVLETEEKEEERVLGSVQPLRGSGSQ